MRSPLNRLSPADYVSALNGIFGFMAISFFFSGSVAKGAAMLSLSILMDGLDGLLARRYGGPHSRGMQVDSFADTISFCVAPAVAIYTSYQGAKPDSLALLSAFTAMFFVFLGIVRLSDFSREGYRLPYFRGLPTPSATLVVISSIIIGGHAWMDTPYFGIFLAIAVSILMVSPIRYPKPRGILAGVSASIIVIFTVLLVVSGIFPWAATTGALIILIGTSAYVIAGPFYCMSSHPKTI